MIDITNIRAYDGLPLARRMFSLDLFPQCHIVHQPEIKAPAVLVWKPEKLRYCPKVVVPGHIAGIRCFHDKLTELERSFRLLYKHRGYDLQEGLFCS